MLVEVVWRVLRFPSAAVGALITTVVVSVAIVGPLLVEADPYSMNLRLVLAPPRSAHVFGTDDFGRDVLSRTLHGTRLSYGVGALVCLATTLFGSVLGLLAGYFRRLDGPIMRVMDGMMAFPSILLALLIAATLGPNTRNVVIALSLVFLPRVARLVRGTVLTVRDTEYVVGGIAIGAGHVRLIVQYVFPNVLAPLFVQATFIYGYAILGEASLSFLGVGTAPPAPSLGNILSDARPMLREAPWLVAFPGLFIALSILGFNLLGDGLRDMLDPRRKGV